MSGASSRRKIMLHERGPTRRKQEEVTEEVTQVCWTGKIVYR